MFRTFLVAALAAAAVFATPCASAQQRGHGRVTVHERLTVRVTLVGHTQMIEPRSGMRYDFMRSDLRQQRGYRGGDFRQDRRSNYRNDVPPVVEITCHLRPVSWRRVRDYSDAQLQAFMDWNVRQTCDPRANHIVADIG